jgi:hypothetical protein
MAETITKGSRQRFYLSSLRHVAVQKRSFSFLPSACQSQLTTLHTHTHTHTQNYTTCHYIIFIKPFPADVTNKQHLGSALKSHFCDLTGKTEGISFPDLMTLFIDPGSL